MTSATPVTPTPTTLISPAASLPVEILDHILSFLFDPLDDTAKHNEVALSLVCRSWTQPVQRYTLQSIEFYSIYTFLLALNGLHSTANAFLKSIVKTCTIYHYGVRDAPWDVMEILWTLSDLPSLTKLGLHMNAGLDFNDWESGVELLGVKELHMSTPSKEGLGIQEWKNIVDAMPNVSKLSLGGYHRWLDIDDPTLVPSVQLPTLTHLSIDTEYPFDASQNLYFIADTTLAQIFRLDLVFRIDHHGSFRGGDTDADIPSWFTAMGPGLRTLSLPVSRYPADGDYNRFCQRALDACPNLVEVIIPQAVYQLRLPPAVKTLRCVPTPGPNSYWKEDYDGAALHNLESWEGVERVLIDCGDRSDTVWRGPVPDGVEIYLNGDLCELVDSDWTPTSTEIALSR